LWVWIQTKEQQSFREVERCMDDCMQKRRTWRFNDNYLGVACLDGRPYLGHIRLPVKRVPAPLLLAKIMPVLLVEARGKTLLVAPVLFRTLNSQFFFRYVPVTAQPLTADLRGDLEWRRFDLRTGELSPLETGWEKEGVEMSKKALRLFGTGLQVEIQMFSQKCPDEYVELARIPLQPSNMIPESNGVFFT
jgi:hypothetical protein